MTPINPGSDGLVAQYAFEGSVHIGSRVTQTSSFPGNVDDAVIYNRVLSAEEVLWIAGRTTPIDKPF